MNFSEQLHYSEIQYILTHFLHLDINLHGKEWQTILSPLRDEKKPSFSISILTAGWKDHGTGQTGDIVDLYALMNNIDVETAIFRIEYIVKFRLERKGFQFDEGLKTEKVSKGISKPDAAQNELSDDIDELLADLPNETAQERLKTETHPLLQQVRSYDLISKETLIEYGCGITEEYGQDWLSIPYKTGVQLYRRENEEKVIRMAKGSKPKNAWFGFDQCNGKPVLIICKSPREAMLLSEHYQNMADIISIVSGETDSVSTRQVEQLRRITKKVHTIKILFDCDTPQAKQIAKGFGQNIARQVSNKCDIQLVNICELTNEKCKDITDYFKDQPDPNKVYKYVLSKGKSLRKRKPRPQDLLNKKWDAREAKPHPEGVYEYLPNCLQDITDLFPDEAERDVFLNAALPVLSAHMPNIHIPHRDCPYSTDLYTIVIAKPGSGKGVAEKARKIGKCLNQKLIEESRKTLKEWESLPKKMKEETQKPVQRQLYLPGNTSSRALYEFLEHNNGRGLIFETEIDTLVSATRQDWGDFTDVIRKGFHHEPSTMRRKADNMYIQRPELSIFMSGTFDQFKKLFESPENGHFSRYAYYTFEAPLKWKSHRPTDASSALSDKLDELSMLMFNAYGILSQRDKPLGIHLEDRHWDTIDNTFSKKMQELEDEGMSRYLQSNNQRTAIIAIRIAAILCVLRNLSKVNLQILKREGLCITDADLEASILLTLNYLDHAVRLFQMLPANEKLSSKGIKFKQFYYKLPKKFETKQAYYIGYEVGISERSVRDYLKSLYEEELIVKESHGLYNKLDR
jgi:hypothetical protein